MITAHKLARKLLEGPDLPIGLMRNCDDHDELCNPVIDQVEGEHPFTGAHQEFLIITRKFYFLTEKSK